MQTRGFHVLVTEQLNDDGDIVSVQSYRITGFRIRGCRRDGVTRFRFIREVTFRGPDDTEVALVRAFDMRTGKCRPFTTKGRRLGHRDEYCRPGVTLSIVRGNGERFPDLI